MLAGDGVTYLLASLSLFIIIGLVIWARYAPEQADGEAPVGESTDGFALKQAILLVGPDMNDPACCAQRTELKRILMPLLQGNYRIIEVYGEYAPTQNGEIYDWLDNQLLRDTLNARTGFNLIFVDGAGEMLFHSTRPVTAEALLHIFDLWDHIDDDAGEALTDVTPEEPGEKSVNKTEPADQTAIAEQTGLAEQDEFSDAVPFSPASGSMGVSCPDPSAYSAGILRNVRVDGNDNAIARLRPTLVSLPVQTFPAFPISTGDETARSCPASMGSEQAGQEGEANPETGAARRRAPSHITALVRQRTS